VTQTRGQVSAGVKHLFSPYTINSDANLKMPKQIYMDVNYFFQHTNHTK